MEKVAGSSPAVPMIYELSFMVALDMSAANPKDLRTDPSKKASLFWRRKGHRFESCIAHVFLFLQTCGEIRTIWI